MTNNCEKYWLNVNKVYLIILFSTIPIAILIPAASFIIPIIFLYGVCDRFLVLNGGSEKKDDSMRLINSLPFSRKQVFCTYTKGITLISAIYTSVIFIIRIILTCLKISKVFLWASNINDGYNLYNYMFLLVLCFLTTYFFLISLFNYYTISQKSIYISISLFVIFPILIFLQYITYIIRFITALIKTKPYVDYDLNTLYKLGISDKASSITSIILFLAIIIFLLITLKSLTIKEYEKYVGVVKK